MLSIVASPKVRMINVRLTPSVHDEFKTACDLKGASMSSLLHQYIVRTIREEKEREPQAFAPKDKIRKGTIHLSDGIKQKKVGRK